VELVVPRARETWSDLLGNGRRGLAELVARESGETFDAAAPRVWVAHEALRKAGLPVDAALVLSSARSDGWVLFTAGDFTGATVYAMGAAEGAPLVLGVMFRSHHEGVRVPARRGV
jgi:enediyne polyketide synthase